MVRYFAEVLASKSDMAVHDAEEVVGECIREELRASGARGLHALNLPMGQLMLGKATAPSLEVASYIFEIRASETERWQRNGVTDQDVVDWWDLGAVVHGAYVAFDNLFNGAQALDAMQNKHDCDSLEELADYAQCSLAKRFPLFGPASSDDGTENGRLPHELRARVEAWTLRTRRESPMVLLNEIQTFDSFNAMCRALIKQGAI